MILTNKEKLIIANLEQLDTIKLDDPDRSNYQYEIEKPSRNEWRVSKLATICLAVEYFSSAEEIYNFIEN